MRIMVGILSIIFCGSCSNYSDKHNLIMAYEKSNISEIYVYDSIDNSITKYDNLGHVIDKHWFDDKDNLYLYTFYNRFYETSNAALKVRFDERKRILDFKGEPFYVSSNLIMNDTIFTDTVKAYMYLAVSPFLNPEVKIYTDNVTSGNQFLVEKNTPNCVLYFEDYPDSNIQKIKYSFFYTLDYGNFKYQDSLIYECFVRNLTSNIHKF